MSSSVAVVLSALDTARWGVTTAKAGGVSTLNLPAVLAFCREKGVRFLIARCSAADLAAAQALEAEGGRLMDTLVYYQYGLAGELPADTPSVQIRELGAADEAGVRRVASECFQGYCGHYHADPALDRRQCDETYVDWAVRSCVSREPSDAVLVADDGGDLCGFLTLRLNGQAEGEGVLFGVAARARRRGIGRSLMTSAMRSLRQSGCSRMVISTQVTNFAAQRVWLSLGFEPTKALHTFHKWF